MNRTLRGLDELAFGPSSAAPGAWPSSLSAAAVAAVALRQTVEMHVSVLMSTNRLDTCQHADKEGVATRHALSVEQTPKEKEKEKGSL